MSMENRMAETETLRSYREPGWVTNFGQTWWRGSAPSAAGRHCTDSSKSETLPILRNLETQQFVLLGFRKGLRARPLPSERRKVWTGTGALQASVKRRLAGGDAR
jgi:hypothetical protein